ncbi:Cerato-platanin-domain-containing protein [Russula ochroleuca]|uniref:Cerato-platanin-domain-containing protein n=1 Tax=Russula ochroleuca TaxID=152965 RepID=A0A9P5MSR4_9AGAM|nr:Cerato-platanin-domain-containing protein [Russula ochroleuca]
MTPHPYESPSKPVDGNEPGPKASSSLRHVRHHIRQQRLGWLSCIMLKRADSGPLGVDQNGLASRFPTFGNIPSFPFIGGAFDIAWNSPNCGACRNLTNMATGVSISLTAVDSAEAGFNIAQEAFEKLNNGQIGQGVLDVIVNKISPPFCGL